MNGEGVELADTDMYMESIKSFVKDSADDIVQKIADMAHAHSGDQPMRDDITILCAKVKG